MPAADCAGLLAHDETVEHISIAVYSSGRDVVKLRRVCALYVAQSRDTTEKIGTSGLQMLRRVCCYGTR